MRSTARSNPIRSDFAVLLCTDLGVTISCNTQSPGLLLTDTPDRPGELSVRVESLVAAALS